MANKSITSAAIGSVTDDTGASSTDFITDDRTLVVGGTVNIGNGNGSVILYIWISGGSFGSGNGTKVGSVTFNTSGNNISWSFDLSVRPATSRVI
jgi:hypothetical protein